MFECDDLIFFCVNFIEATVSPNFPFYHITLRKAEQTFELLVVSFVIIDYTINIYRLANEFFSGRMGMKKVALFSDGWKRLITYAWVDGMMQYIANSDEEIALYQYNCHGNWSLDEKHNYGEYNIYTLPDLSEFDGIILDCTNIRVSSYLDQLITMIRLANKPTVSISQYIEDFFYTGIDNKKPIADMIEHLYHVHNCRRFIFAGGPKDNYENSLRTASYLESIERLGLFEDDNPVWYGDYDFSTGLRYFEDYIKGFHGRDIVFPDVFVCANDNIAAGICHQAQLFGYEIPKDFKVTGFDNLDKAAYFDPQITTVAHMRENIGNKAMKILSDVWAGKEVPQMHFMPSVCYFSESCGCPNSGLLDYRKYAKDQVIAGIDKLNREELLIKLESDIVKCADYDAVFEQIAEYFANLECDGFAFVVDKRMYEGADENCFVKDGYDFDNLIVAYMAEGIKRIEIREVSELFRFCDEKGAKTAYMFTPIHFREHAVGFSMLINAKFLYDNPYFYDLHNTITKTLENLYKKLLLEVANKKLMDIYNRDQLTGLYNRIAYSEMIEPEYRKHCDRGRKCAVSFIDADHFKQINDTYGHEKGDLILKRIAAVLLEKRPKEGYVYRYGGDEFIAFFPIDDDAQIETFRTEVIRELDKYDISVSIGFATTDPLSDMAFDEYLKLADNDMYRVKAAKKRPFCE